MGGGVDFGRTFGAAAIVMALGYKNKTRFRYIFFFAFFSFFSISIKKFIKLSLPERVL